MQELVSHLGPRGIYALILVSLSAFHRQPFPYRGFSDDHRGSVHHPCHPALLSLIARLPPVEHVTDEQMLMVSLSIRMVALEPFCRMPLIQGLLAGSHDVGSLAEDLRQMFEGVEQDVFINAMRDAHPQFWEEFVEPTWFTDRTA